MKLHPRLTGVIMATVAVCLAGSCGGSESPASPTPPPTVVNPASEAVTFVSIGIHPPSGGVLVAGTSRAIGATFRRASGEYTCPGVVGWRTSDSAIATVSQGAITGISAGDVTITATCLGTSGTLLVRVYRSVTMSGIVTDDRGSPLSGVGVSVSDGKWPHHAITDGSGRYRFDRLPGGLRTSVEVRLDGYRAQHTSMTLDDMTLNFTMPFIGFVVGGRTTEVGGTPLAGVTIEAIEGPNEGVRMTSTSWGSYALSDLRPGTLKLRAGKAGYDSVERFINVSKSTTVNFELTQSR